MKRGQRMFHWGVKEKGLAEPADCAPARSRGKSVDVVAAVANRSPQALPIGSGVSLLTSGLHLLNSRVANISEH